MITKLYKENRLCACGCNRELMRLDLVNKIDNKYFGLYCGKIYRLLVESTRRIRVMAKQVRKSNVKQ